MSSNVVVRFLLRIVTVATLSILSCLLLLGSVPVLFNESWRLTIDALGPPHAIVQFQAVFVLGVCCMALAIFVLVKPLFVGRKIA